VRLDSAKVFIVYWFSANYASCSAVMFHAVGAMLTQPSDEVLALCSFSGGGVERCALGIVGNPVEVRSTYVLYQGKV